MAKASLKTEHRGAKKGEGFLGRRKVAKQVSRKERRARDLAETEHAGTPEPEPHQK